MLGGWPRSSLALYRRDVQQILLCRLVKWLPMWASLDLAFVEALVNRDICKVGLGVMGSSSESFTALWIRARWSFWEWKRHAVFTGYLDGHPLRDPTL